MTNQYAGEGNVSFDGGSDQKEAVDAGLPSPGASANSDGLLRALEQATDSMAIVTIDDNNSGNYSKSYRWLGKEVITNIGFSENYIECGVDGAPELAAYLKSRSEARTSEPSEPFPTTTNQEKIPASKDPEGKEK